MELGFSEEKVVNYWCVETKLEDIFFLYTPPLLVRLSLYQDIEAVFTP